MTTNHRPAYACPESAQAFSVQRRQILQAGALGTLGFGLTDLFRGQQASANTGVGLPGFGRAKACILLFAWGGPSQIDTLDPKPDAPKEVRGDFNPIDTNVNGIQIGEHFHRLAGHIDKCAIVRSLTHDDPAHLSSGHLALTGHLAPVVRSDAQPPSDRDTPHIGSVMAKLRTAPAGLPSFVTMPWLAAHSAAPGGRAPGQHGGWLGHKYDPFLVTGDPSKPDWKVPALTLLDGISERRLGDRRSLLQFLDTQRAGLSQLAHTNEMSAHQQRAFGLLTAPTVRRAFDLTEENDADRDRYGRNIHGQSVLLARRLVEHGVPLVSVNWHDDGRNYWDTHGNNFPRLKNDLIPPTDRAISALFEDLERSGLLEETIVAWVGEFGRSPRINASAGREHHPYCYSGLFAGGGIRGGTVYGASDKQAGHPAEKPVVPQDFVATLYHALGVGPEDTLNDHLSRPHRIYEGKPLESLFG